MKLKLLFLFCALVTFSNAQTINFPDSNFKTKLLASNTTNGIAKDATGTSIKIDLNNNNEVELSEALLVYKLNISPSSNGIGPIASIEGIGNFVNLTDLITNYNVITAMDLSSLSNLESLGCYNNQLTTLNVQNCTLLKNLYCQNNNLASLNLNNLSSLIYFQCSNNQLTTLNLDNCSSLDNLFCDNNQLTTLNINSSNSIKYFACNNNNLQTIFSNNNSIFNIGLDFYNNPNLTYICTNTPLYQAKANSYGLINCVINSYCSFLPSGAYNTLKGSLSYDLDENGCDANDIYLNIIKVKSTLGSSIRYTTTLNNEYSFYFTSTGNYLITPELEYSNYFTVSPSNANVFFPNVNYTQSIQDFCISPNGTHNDLEIMLLPLNAALPGFDSNYKIIFKNNGTTTQSGSIDLSFNDIVLDFMTATIPTSNQSNNLLNWNFANLLPFESREIDVTFNLNMPTETPPLQSGDILNFAASINDQTDETPNDNSFILNQLVVNSYDPNDKTCLEGATITPDKIGEYVHYLIRFENNGTANAQNIVVKDLIDTTKFDITTLIPVQASHSFETRITNTNKVEFIFQNINLPFDNPNNDGYVLFKIKTKSNLVVGNTFSNLVNIYFDYNFPITTNNYTTTVENFLDLQENELKTQVAFYPNPVINVLFFKTEENIMKVEIYDTMGRIISSKSITENKIDLSELTTGNYIIKAYTGKGILNTTICKE